MKPLQFGVCRREDAPADVVVVTDGNGTLGFELMAPLGRVAELLELPVNVWFSGRMDLEPIVTGEA